MKGNSKRSNQASTADLGLDLIDDFHKGYSFIQQTFMEWPLLTRHRNIPGD